MLGSRKRWALGSMLTACTAVDELLQALPGGQCTPMQHLGLVPTTEHARNPLQFTIVS